MKKKTKVIIKDNQNKLGNKGDIINVSRGYAFNYLIPQNLAELATKGKLKNAEMFKQIQNNKLEKATFQAQQLQENLAQISKINIKKKVGNNQQIFGSVNEKEVIGQIFKYTGQKLEKKQIILPEIKKIGIYYITINLLETISINLKLQILPEDTEINI